MFYRFSTPKELRGRSGTARWKAPTRSPSRHQAQFHKPLPDRPVPWCRSRIEWRRRPDASARSNALHWTQAHAERRALFVKQSAAGKALHDRDADVVFFTDAVQLRAVRVNASQPASNVSANIVSIFSLAGSISKFGTIERILPVSRERSRP